MRKLVLLSLISVIPFAQAAPSAWATKYYDSGAARSPINNTPNLNEPINNAAYSGAASGLIVGPHSSLSATPEAFYAEGMKNFKAANYAYAENYFRNAAKLRPKDGMIRYYLATCLVYQHRHPEAIAQYRMSYKLDPYGLVSGFCRRALVAYNVPVDGTTDPRKIVRKPRAARKVDEGQLQKAITASELQMEAAVVTIKRQAEEEKSRKKIFAKGLSDSAIKAGDHKAKSIKDDAEDQIRALIDAEYARQQAGLSRRTSLYGRYSDAEMVKQQAEQIRREAEAKAKLEQDIAQERSRKHQEWSETRQKDMDSVADNLQKQLQTTPAQRSISINPVGTGLYVRNYTPPRKKGPESRNAVVRFVDKLGEDPAELGSETGDNSSEDDLESKEFSQQVSGRVVDENGADKRVNEKINQSISEPKGTK